MWYSSPGNVPILLKMWLYSFMTYLLVMGRLCFFLWIHMAASSTWLFWNLRSWPILPISFCFGVFTITVFRWTCTLGVCVSFGRVISENICSLFVVLFHGQGWGILLCLWPETLLSGVPDFKWGELQKALVFPTLNSDLKNVQGHSITCYSSVNFTVKLVYLCFEACWHQK